MSSSVTSILEVARDAVVAAQGLDRATNQPNPAAEQRTLRAADRRERDHHLDFAVGVDSVEVDVEDLATQRVPLHLADQTRHSRTVADLDLDDRVAVHACG